jgi:hypothetical protein
LLGDTVVVVLFEAVMVILVFAANAAPLEAISSRTAGITSFIGFIYDSHRVFPDRLNTADASQPRLLAATWL